MSTEALLLLTEEALIAQKLGRIRTRKSMKATNVVRDPLAYEPHEPLACENAHLTCVP